MAENGDEPVKALSYTSFMDGPAVPFVVADTRKAIVFNVRHGSIRLVRAEGDERGMPSIDAVMELVRTCDEQCWPPPHTLTVNHPTYDYLAGLLNGTIDFPRRKRD